MLSIECPSHGWRNRGGGDREGPFPPGPINSISWVGPGGQIYNENGPFLLLLGYFSAIAIVVAIGGFGPFKTLGDPFPRGPLRPSPLHLWNHFFSPGTPSELISVKCSFATSCDT